MERGIAENLFYPEQCKMLYYFAGNYQLDLTNRSYCEFTNFTFSCTVTEIIDFCLV